MLLTAIALLLGGAVLTWKDSGPIGAVGSLSIAGLAALILVAPSEKTRRLAQRWLWILPFLSGVLLESGVLLLSNQRGNVRFFELVSQVIPILLLALVLELRLFSSRISIASGQISLGLLTVLFLAMGEAQSLGVVVSQRPSEAAFATAIAALGTGLVALLVGALAESD